MPASGTLDERPPGCPWTGHAPATLHYCEENLCAWVAAPANTWSNLAYVLAAVWIWRRRREAASRAVRWFAPIALAVGAASFLYHASFLFALQVCDLTAMYLFSGLLLALDLARAGLVTERRVPLAFGLAAGVPVAAVIVLRGPWGPVLFGVEVLAVLALEIALWRRAAHAADYRDLRRAILALAVAWGFWWVDLTRVWCDPRNHVVQGHALWHMVNSLCFPFLFRYYRQFFPRRGPA